MEEFNKYKGVRCPVCQRELNNDAENAVCPVCGTPHHRACFHELGHCANESLHGTDFVFEIPKEDEASQDNASRSASGDHTGHTCPRCHSRSTSDTLFCPYCGFAFGDNRYSPEETGDPDRPPVSPFSFGFADPLGGVDPTETIDSVAVSDLALFIGPNTHRYLPAFLNLKHGHPRRTGWNWAAFLMPVYWFAFRKMYLQAAVVGIIGLIFPLFSYPMLTAVSPILSSMPQNSSITAMMETLARQMVDQPDLIPPVAVVLALAGMILGLIYRIVCALLADWIYMRHAVSSIRTIEEDDEIEDRELYIRTRGGINFFAAFLALFASYQLSQLLAWIVLS